MITKEDYLKALKIVEDYHIYIGKLTDKNKISLNNIIYDLNTPRRLANIIKVIHITHGVQFINDITKRQFMRTRNAGKTSWNQFIKIRGF